LRFIDSNAMNVKAISRNAEAREQARIGRKTKDEIATSNCASRLHAKRVVHSFGKKQNS